MITTARILEFFDFLKIKILVIFCNFFIILEPIAAQIYSEQPKTLKNVIKPQEIPFHRDNAAKNSEFLKFVKNYLTSFFSKLSIFARLIALIGQTIYSL